MGNTSLAMRLALFCAALAVIQAVALAADEDLVKELKAKLQESEEEIDHLHLKIDVAEKKVAAFAPPSESPARPRGLGGSAAFATVTTNSRRRIWPINNGNFDWKQC